MQLVKNTIFYIFLFLICLSFAAHALGYDYDLWARLIVGQSVFETGHVLTRDFLSYTPTHEWIDHEWGASVIIYAFQHWFGAAGIIWLQTILTFFLLCLVGETRTHIILAPDQATSHPIGLLLVISVVPTGLEPVLP